MDSLEYNRKRKISEIQNNEIEYKKIKTEIENISNKNLDTETILQILLQMFNRLVAIENDNNEIIKYKNTCNFIQTLLERKNYDDIQLIYLPNNMNVSYSTNMNGSYSTNMNGSYSTNMNGSYSTNMNGG